MTWVPTPRVHASFLRVFPHVMSVADILVGSNQPIVFDRAVLAARLSDPRIVNHYQAAGIDIRTLMQPYLEAPVMYEPADDRGGLIDTNTDLFPKDEYRPRPDLRPDQTTPIMNGRRGCVTTRRAPARPPDGWTAAHAGSEDGNHVRTTRTLTRRSGAVSFQAIGSTTAC